MTSDRRVLMAAHGSAVEAQARNKESACAVKRTFLRHLPFVFVFILAIILLTINVATPWHSLHEDTGLAFENAAINHIRFGLSFTKGQDYFDRSIVPPAFVADGITPRGISSAQEFQYFRFGAVQPVLYGHHPPLLGLTIAGSLLTFGYHFWAVRLVPIVFTLCALTLFYMLMTVLFDRRTAAFASALFITFPIAAYYGRNVAHEAPTLCCEIGMALCYLQWRCTGRNFWLPAVGACVALGVAYGWPMVFFAWILLALDVLVVRHVVWKLALVTGGAATIMFTLLVTQIAWADHWSLNTLRDAFTLRSGSFGSSPGDLQALEWLQVLLRHNLQDFGLWTWLALPLTALFLWRRFSSGSVPAPVAVWRRFQHSDFPLRGQLIALFALGGLTHILVFRNGAYMHDYWQFYLIPFYAAACGWGGVTLASRLAAHPLLARVRGPGASLEAAQSLLLLLFAGLALAMNVPFIYYLYSTHVLITPA